MADVISGIDVLRRRPDVIAAERRLAVSNENIGAAISDYCPKISISGALGFDNGSGVGVLPSPVGNQSDATTKADSSLTPSQLRLNLVHWSVRITAPIRRTWSFVLREYEIARSISQLARMDDRTLRDIGIERCDIPPMVRQGRDRDA